MSRPRGSSRPRDVALQTLLAILLALPATLLLAGVPSPAAGQDTLRLSSPGLERPVTIVRDRWGINHIYAETQPDLFFAQGWAAARDRLFQFEIWRRQATGTVAEILGPRELERDIGTRLFQFRGDMEQEMAHYHPDGVEIITSYVRGVNAWIDETRTDPDLLPVTFDMLGIRPEHWTPEVVISRHQGLLGNIGSELDYGRAVHLLGPERVKDLEYFHPHEPEIALDPAIDGELLMQDILARYEAFRRPIDFQPEDVAPEYRPTGGDAPDVFGAAAGRGAGSGGRVRASHDDEATAALERVWDREVVGSNNWVVSGELTLNGWPFMVNDPHRVQAVPSLRYWVHLVGPGWNVIGGGEPEIPGVSIGHNEYGGWGLTVFSTDGEDLYVYDTNPSNPRQYRYQGRWEDMRVIQETIPVEGQDPVTVDLEYTRHGPVVYRDDENDKAYAIRAAWMEIGGAPYLASLRMDQARTWEEFREACSYSHIPGENMIWADREGNIGWQAVGIAPIRRTWSGLVPVPGDGTYEWDGYLPIKDKPHVLNPEEGFFATANSNHTPRDFAYLDAIGFNWADPYRWARVSEVLASGRKLSMQDMVRLQHDYLSLPAREIVPLLEPLESDDSTVEEARRRLLEWDHVLDAESVEAGIYVAFERAIQRNVQDVFVPEEAQDYVAVGMKRTIELLLAPPAEFGSDPLEARDAFLLDALEQAVADLREKLGGDVDDWVYGQARYKHALIRHPLTEAVNEEWRERLDVGPAPRGGNGYTVGNTGGGDNQTSGASFRIFVDTGDWDNALGMNNPGQVGDPGSPHYEDLFPLWAEDRVFPAFYSRERVEGVADEVVVLTPGS